MLFACIALISFTITYAQETLKTVKGKIMYLDGPVVNAVIKVSSSDATLKSTVDGSYEVQAYQGDIITFSYPSLRAMEVVVEDVTRILNISMSPDVNVLDEVVVEASKRRSQRDMEEDYVINENIIRTAYGYIDGQRSAGQIRIMKKDEILGANVCLFNLLRNRFAIIKGNGDCQNPNSVLWLGRGSGSLENIALLIYDIDGQIFTDIPNWVDLNSVEQRFSWSAEFFHFSGTTSLSTSFAVNSDNFQVLSSCVFPSPWTIRTRTVGSSAVVSKSTVA